MADGGARRLDFPVLDQVADCGLWRRTADRYRVGTDVDLEHGSVANAVTSPAVAMARAAPSQIADASANVPDMPGRIPTAVARAGLDIHNTADTSHGEMADTRVDIDSPNPPGVLREVAAIAGLLAVHDLPASHR